MKCEEAKWDLVRQDESEERFLTRELKIKGLVFFDCSKENKKMTNDFSIDFAT